MSKRLGSRLRRARLAQGVAQGLLAQKVGVSQATISNWEKGKGRPGEKELRSIQKVLGPFNSPAPSSGGGSRSIDPTSSPSGRLFGNWLRHAREHAKFSVHELARASGVSQVQIYNLEAGRSISPRDETRTKLETALHTSLPEDVEAELAAEQSIEGLGPLTDFDPHDPKDRPECAGVYVFYDVSDRPIYIGKAGDISARVRSHVEKFWFKFPIVSHGAFVEIVDERLRHQVEQVLIKFLKSNAVVNKQSVDRT